MKKISAIVAALALVAVATPAYAFVFPFPGNDDGGDITVSVDNSAYVKNVVDTRADTGDNSSGGGSARSRASARGFFSDAQSTANGGDGGSVTTGDADAKSAVYNDVNVNDVVVDADCGCDGDIDVTLGNRGTVKNYVDTTADTGDNSSWGSRAKSKARASWGGDSTSTANGGDGGDVDTGAADSESDVKSYVNTNIVRVLR